MHEPNQIFRVGFFLASPTQLPDKSDCNKCINGNVHGKYVYIFGMGFLKHKLMWKGIQKHK